MHIASQWQLVWRNFKKHRLAVISAMVVLGIYLIALFAEFIAPYAPDTPNPRYTYAPPQRIKWVRRTDDGLKVQLHVHGHRVEIDPMSFRRIYTSDPETIYPIGFFVKGHPYKLWGLIPMDRHLIGPLDPSAPVFFFGTDRLGRDMLSRVIYGARISMSIGLVGVALSLLLGIFLGGISGYFGGPIDTLIQRVIELLQSIPTIPLWMAMAASIPLSFSPVQVYFLITVILSLIGWTGLAREVRGKFLALKTEDFVIAARLDGASELRIIRKHMVPSFMSHIIATITLAIPSMIIAETSLSFLGIGLRPPVVSWGVLLQEAQNVRSVATAPWLLLPGLFVVIAVLSLNFLGDGLRDAADPYSG